MAKHEKRLLDEIMPPREIKDEDIKKIKQTIEDLQNHKYTDEELDALVEECRHNDEIITGYDKNGHRLTFTHHPAVKKNKSSD